MTGVSSYESSNLHEERYITEFLRLAVIVIIHFTQNKFIANPEGFQNVCFLSP